MSQQCPSFLFTSEPAFPWCPALVDVQEGQRILKSAAAQYQTDSDGALLSATQSLTLAASPLDDTIKQVTIDLQNNPTSLSPTTISSLERILDANTPLLIQQAGLTQTTDEVLLLIVNQLISPSTSYSRSYTISHYMLLPRILDLAQPPSRETKAVVEQMSAAQCQALLDGCLAGLFQNHSINKYQAELLIHGAVKIFPILQLSSLCIAACSPSSVQQQQQQQVWTEDRVTIVQAILDRKPQLTNAEDILIISKGFVVATQALAGSVKLSKLLMSFIKTYGGGGDLNDESKKLIRDAAGSVTTFMKKPLLAALDKL